MKDMERENTRLKRLVADLSLEKQILKGHPGGKLVAPDRCLQAVGCIRDWHGLSERPAPVGLTASRTAHSDMYPRSGLMKMR